MESNQTVPCTNHVPMRIGLGVFSGFSGEIRLFVIRKLLNPGKLRLDRLPLASAKLSLCLSITYRNLCRFESKSESKLSHFSTGVDRIRRWRPLRPTQRVVRPWQEHPLSNRDLNRKMFVMSSPAAISKRRWLMTAPCPSGSFRRSRSRKRFAGPKPTD